MGLVEFLMGMTLHGKHTRRLACTNHIPHSMKLKVKKRTKERGSKWKNDGTFTIWKVLIVHQ